MRPRLYHEINNFYTATVYEKGAEVVRMIKTLLGPETFRQGMDLYFTRHDGEAATIEQFVQCFADVSGADFTQFMLWYSQAGTPEVVATGGYDARARTYRLEVAQTVPPTPGQPSKEPMVIPLAIGLVGRDGRDLPLKLSDGRTIERGVLTLTRPAETFVFGDIGEPPVPSLNRGFSAPIKLVANLSADDLRFLAAHDVDPFNRWQALQTLATRLLLDNVANLRAGKPARRDSGLLDALGAVLGDGTLEPAFIALALTLPGESDLAREIGRDVDPDAIFAARSALAGGGRRPSRRTAVRSLPPPVRKSALYARCRRRRAARAAQCLSRSSGGDRPAGRRVAGRSTISGRRQHDRSHGGALDAVASRRARARRGARRFLRPLWRRSADRRQMVHAAGHHSGTGNAWIGSRR